MGCKPVTGEDMTAVVVSNGSIQNYSYYKEYFERAQFIIGADGGASHLRKLGIKPHLLVGDFDSINGEDLEYFRNLGVEIQTFPVQKDMTDTELAAKIAAEKGCKSIVFIGSLGSRLDHSLSNVFLLKKLLDQGIKGIAVNEQNEIHIINDKISMKKHKDMKVTLLPLTYKVFGVTTKGLYYPLNNATLEMGSTWGVSNEFSADHAEVSITEGLMLVIKSRD